MQLGPELSLEFRVARGDYLRELACLYAVETIVEDPLKRDAFSSFICGICVHTPSSCRSFRPTCQRVLDALINVGASAA